MKSNDDLLTEYDSIFYGIGEIKKCDNQITM